MEEYEDMENCGRDLYDLVQLGDGDDVLILFPDEDNFENSVEMVLDYSTIRMMANEPYFVDIFCDTEEQSITWKELMPEILKIVEEKRALYDSAELK